MRLKHCTTAASCIAAASVLLLAACASTPPPIADLARAHALLSQAQQSDAPRYDSADLAAAQQKVQLADEDAKDRPARAARLAQEASVDAELALARTRANKEQEALDQVNASMQALRSQALQNQETPATPAPPAPVNTLPPGGAQQ